MKRFNPWTSPVKANDFMRRNNWTNKEIEDWNYARKSDFFDYKEQSKKYMLRTVAPRHSLIIDFFFPGKFIYLLAINMNTRKAFAIPSTQIREIREGTFTVRNTNNRTVKTSVDLLNELRNQTPIKHLMCDQEKAFLSKVFKDECKKHDIELLPYIKNNVKGIVETAEESRGNHTTLSLIDRLARTLRRMNYNLGNSTDINPKVMELLLEEYNNSPHQTLSAIVGKPVTPNMVDSSELLEDFIVESLLRENFKTKSQRDFNVVGKEVRCLNESSKFDKIKTKLLPGVWKVVGTDGGMFVCKQGENTIKLPRWMLKQI